MDELGEVIRFIVSAKLANPGADKQRIQAQFVEHFSPKQKRSLFLGKGYSLRFSHAKGSSFSNTVLGLSALRPADSHPMVVCVVSPAGVRFMLANSTFLKKVSHSSLDLRIDNVRGSFNGSDIVSEYGGVSNEPQNFDSLFAMHLAFTWTENLERLVEATNAIVARVQPFQPTGEERALILEAPRRAAVALSSTWFAEVESELQSIVAVRRADIALAANVENVNLRGNRVERLITGGTNAHTLGDLQRDLDGWHLVVDVKTKLSDRGSAPKAYNVDKMLAFHAQRATVFAFLVVLIDVAASSVAARLVPVLDEAVLDATVVQHHWAGRGSRGVTQLSGHFERVLEKGYTPHIDTRQAENFLEGLLGR